MTKRLFKVRQDEAEKYLQQILKKVGVRSNVHSYPETPGRWSSASYSTKKSPADVVAAFGSVLRCSKADLHEQYNNGKKDFVSMDFTVRDPNGVISDVHTRQHVGENTLVEIRWKELDL